MTTDKKDLMILMPYDISNVQGSTAVYHITNGVSETHNVHLFSKQKPDFNVSSYHPLPDAQSSYLPSLLIYNFLLLPKITYYYLYYSPDLIYSYKGFLLPPYILNWFNPGWIVDLRTAPLEQQIERRKDNEDWGQVEKVYFLLYKLLYSITLPHADNIITLSPGIRRILIEDYGVCSNNITIIPLGVDTERFSPKRFRDDQTVRKTLHIAYIGVIKSYREFDIILKSLARLPSSEGVELHIFGKGNEEYIEEMKILASELGITKRVRWHGYIGHNKIPEELYQMDVGLSPLPPDNSYQVSCPAKVMEYLAMGLPVICTDIIPHREMVDDGETGFFYESGDAEQLSKVIRNVNALSVEDRGLISRKSREVALNHDWSNMINTVNQLIENSAP